MKIDGNQIKVGNILEIQTRLWRVLKTQHTQPGKGGAKQGGKGLTKRSGKR